MKEKLLRINQNLIKFRKSHKKTFEELLFFVIEEIIVTIILTYSNSIEQKLLPHDEEDKHDDPLAKKKTKFGRNYYS